MFWTNLKAAIAAAIKTNNNQEITGAILQSTLNSIVNSVGANATFAGIATPSTNPGTPDGPVFYITSQGGQYTNFDNIELQDGLSVLMWNGTAWDVEQLIGIDAEPTAGSDNLVKSGGVQNELALGAVYDVSAKNTTAGPNNDGKFESLSELLSDANLNILIPTAYRKGGMSIKFVQSSDNKYVQYRLIADEFTTDVTKWAIADEGVYVENPEYVYVKTDAEGKILFAIKVDGSIYYGAGCPKQVKDYIEEKIAELSLDEYEDIVSFLSDYLGSDTTLKVLIDSKLDAEGLDSDALATEQAVENPEYIQVTTDSEGRIIKGIKKNGEIVNNTPLSKKTAVKLYNELVPELLNQSIILEYGTIASGIPSDDPSYYNIRVRTASYIQAPFSVQLNAGYVIRKLYKYQIVDNTIQYIGEKSILNDFYAESDTNYLYKFVCNKTNESEPISNIDAIIAYSYIGSARLDDKYSKDISINALRRIAQFNSGFSAHYAGNLLREQSNFTFPEYSQYNIVLAKKAGFDILGINIKMTSDGVVVCSHDKDINRTMRAKDDYNTPLAETINIAEHTYQELAENYVCQSSIERLRLPLLTLEEAVKTCKALNMGIILLDITDETSKNAIAVLNKYGITDYGIIGTTRYSGFDGLLIVPSKVNTKRTTAEILNILKNVGKPAGYMLFNADSGAPDYTPLYNASELKEIADTLHENGFIMSCSLYEQKSLITELKKLASFDYSNMDSEVPEFNNGDVVSVRSIADFSNFICTGEYVSNGTMSANDKIGYITANPPVMSKACVKVHFSGSITLTFGNGYSNVPISSDGDCVLIFTNVFYNAAPTFEIKATDDTQLYDISFDVSRVM